MNDKDFEIVNSEKFVAKFIGEKDNFFNIQKSPIQVYPLETTAQLVKVPTPLFRTEYNFLLLFSEGGGKQQVDNEILELKSNDVLFIREGHLNAIQSIYSPSSGYFIYIDSVLLSQIFPSRTVLNQFTFYPKYKVSPTIMTWLTTCCSLLHKDKIEGSNSIELQVTLLKAIITKLSTSSVDELAKPDRQTEIVMLFKELLYENFKEKRAVSFYADSLAVSENYLNRCLKNVTKKAPKQHINEVVIYHSQALLQDGSKDISQIAFELNFTDPAYFARLFKHITGTTPSAYRHSFMQDLS